MDQRFLHLRGATGKSRLETFNGREYVVTPVVALMEAVIFAINAETPEFVPVETLKLAPFGWNGRPVVMGHPSDGDVMISANAPTVLERVGFGIIFNTAVVETKLSMEAWLDKEQAAVVGDDAVRVLERIAADEVVEVSVGAWVTVEKTEGQFNDQSYGAIWRDILPDHLAMLPEGDQGACSVDMGCGTRAAKQHHLMHLVSAQGLSPVLRTAKERQMPAPAPKKKASLRERFASVIRSLGGNLTPEISDVDIRQELMDAIKSKEPRLSWIERVYSDRVVYACYNDDYTASYYQRTYDQQGNVFTAADTRIEVQLQESWVPVDAVAAVTAAKARLDAIRTAAGARHSSADMALIQSVHDQALELGAGCAEPAPTTAATHLCGKCGGPSPTAAANKPPEGENAMTKAERIRLLLASDHNPLKSQAALEAADEASLTALETHCTNAKTLADAAAAVRAAATPPQPAPAPVPDPRTFVPQTEEQYLANAPQSIRDLVTRQKAQDAQRRTELVGGLKTAQSVYTEAELNAMPIADLEKTAKLCGFGAVGRVDFSGLGGPRPEPGPEDVYANPPDGYRIALDAQKAQTSKPS